MKKIWTFLAFLLMIIGISACTNNLVQDFIYTYPVHHFEKAKGVVFDIESEKGLYTPPAYFAKVEIIKDVPTDGIYPYTVRISKKQVMQAREGKPINGYTSDGKDFHTTLDVLYNGAFYFLFIGIGIFLIGLTIFIWMAFNEERFKFFFNWIGKIPIEDPVQKVILLSLIIPGTIYYVFVLINLGQKINPFPKEVIEADVIMAHYEYNRLHDSYHTLSLGYETAEDGYITASKEVSYWTYRKYESGDTIKIAVPKNNPYNVFITNLSISEILSSFLKIRIYFMAPLTVILIWLYHLLYSKSS